MVGLEEKVTSGDQNPGEGSKKLLLDEAPPVMPDLWPRIGKQQVESADRGVWKKPFHGIAGLKSQDPQVGETCLRRAFAGLADPAEKAFDGEKVALRKLLRHGKGKIAVSRPEIDFQRGLSCEQFSGREAAEIIPRDELSGLSGAR